MTKKFISEVKVLLKETELRLRGMVAVAKIKSAEATSATGAIFWSKMLQERKRHLEIIRFLKRKVGK